MTTACFIGLYEPVSSFVCFCGIFVPVGMLGNIHKCKLVVRLVSFPILFTCPRQEVFFKQERFIICAIHGMDIDM